MRGVAGAWASASLWLSLAACAAEPAPSPTLEAQPPASIPLALLEPGTPAPSPRPVAPAPRPPPRDPLAAPAVVSSAPARCTAFGRLSPSADEDGHWAAVRLTPKTTPFRVDRVWMTLIHGSTGGVQCDASTAHELRLYVVPAGGAPPNGQGADPRPAASYTFFANKEQPRGDRQLTAQVAGDVVLQAGESLIVAVNTHASRSGARTCLKTCLDGTSTRGNFWSNQALPPAWSWTVWSPARGAGLIAELEGSAP